MTFPKRVFGLILLAGLTGCSGSVESPDADGEESSAAQVRPGATSGAVPAVELSELAQKGKRVYLRCQACHRVEVDGPHLVGPNLHGLIGATAGVKEGYVFSERLSGSGLVWDEDTLDQWIEAPQSLVPGTKMAFPGLPKKEDRAAVIQYLKEVTK